MDARSHDLSSHPADNCFPEGIWAHCLECKCPCNVLLEVANEVGVSVHVEVEAGIELCIRPEISSTSGSLVVVNILEVASLLWVAS